MTRAPIILLHGMWGTFQSWGDIPARLEEGGWRVLPYELPGHGARREDTRKLTHYGLREHADDLNRFIAAQSENPIVIGHSMGGFLALKAAETGNIKAVFMITPAGAAGGFPFSLTNLIFFARPLTLQLFGAQAFKPTRWESDFALCNCIKEPERSQVFASLQDESPWPLLQLAYWFLNPGGAAWIKWDRINAPVRMYLAGRDRVIPRYFPSAIRNKIKDFRLHIEPDACHMVHWQKDRDRFMSWLLSELVALP
ncbi:MAG: alpha/beta fold hydrolase [Rhodomicrobium sp.]